MAVFSQCVEGQPSHVALIGNFLPRRCGLATFTVDVSQAMRNRYPGLTLDVYAMNDRAAGYDYPSEVLGTISQESLEEYHAIARRIAQSNAEILWIQHEFGIFGGSAGRHIVALAEAVAIPLVVTLHTVLADPNDDQRQVMDALGRRAAKLVVMAEYGRRLLIDVYGVPSSRIAVVPHGIPDRPFGVGASIKSQKGWAERTIVMTFGLLSPGKGIETMIRALPAIVGRFPDVLYLTVGATHPNLLAQRGEEYRNQLKTLATELGVAGHIRWIDDFLPTQELLDLLGAADIYITPYLNPAQITSGTLAYAIGLGKAVVSTPYVHARELLANDHGRLVAFADPEQLAGAVIDLLLDPRDCDALRRRAYARGRSMIWPRFAEQMMSLLSGILADHREPLVAQGAHRSACLAATLSAANGAVYTRRNGAPPIGSDDHRLDGSRVQGAAT